MSVSPELQEPYGVAGEVITFVPFAPRVICVAGALQLGGIAPTLESFPPLRHA
jgi:hypothetical protein